MSMFLSLPMATFRSRPVAEAASAPPAGIDDVSPFVKAPNAPAMTLAEPRQILIDIDPSTSLRTAARSLGGLVLRRVLALEAVDAAGRIDQLLLAGEERMALRADLDAKLLASGAGGPALTACAVDLDLVIFRVNLWFH